MNKDFKEFIELLNSNSVDYLIVGGYAVGFYGYPRYTGDLDVWIRVSKENAEKILDALNQFGFGSLGLNLNDFIQPDQIVQLGYPPNRIDIITSCDGVDFDQCFSKREVFEVDSLKINFIDFDSLKKNKAASNRPQDIADLDNLMPK